MLLLPSPFGGMSMSSLLPELSTTILLPAGLSTGLVGMDGGLRQTSALMSSYTHHTQPQPPPFMHQGCNAATSSRLLHGAAQQPCCPPQEQWDQASPPVPTGAGVMCNCRTCTSCHQVAAQRWTMQLPQFAAAGPPSSAAWLPCLRDMTGQEASDYTLLILVLLFSNCCSATAQPCCCRNPSY